MLGEAMPFTRLVELPGRGTTRVWECAGPPGAQTLMLIHGVTFTAELNWGRAFAPLGRHFRVVAADLRGHGDGIRLRSRFRLEDGADDIAALAGVLETGGFAAVGHSMGGLVAQLLYRRAAVVRRRAAGGLPVGRAWPRQHAAHASQTRPARVSTAP